MEDFYHKYMYFDNMLKISYQSVSRIVFIQLEFSIFLTAFVCNTGYARKITSIATREIHPC